MARFIAFVLAVLSTSIARADGPLYANAYVDRPLVLPSEVWGADASASITTLPSGSPLVVAPRVGTRIGAPSVYVLPPGLEAGVSLPFVLSPFPPAPAPGIAGYVMQRLAPWPAQAVDRTESALFELALSFGLGGEPVLPDLGSRAAQFAVTVGLPLAVRVPHALRLALTPQLSYYAASDLVAITAPLSIAAQPADHVWLGLASGVALPNLVQSRSLQIALGLQAGATITNAFGPILDLVLDAGFPRLFLPSSTSDTVDARTFQVQLGLRFYSYWALRATLGAGQRPEDPRCQCVLPSEATP